MIQKTVKITSLNDTDQIESDLQYWLSRYPEERLSAVEILRSQYNGNTPELQRTVKVIQMA